MPHLLYSCFVRVCCVQNKIPCSCHWNTPQAENLKVMLGTTSIHVNRQLHDILLAFPEHRSESGEHHPPSLSLLPLTAFWPLLPFLPPWEFLPNTSATGLVWTSPSCSFYSHDSLTAFVTSVIMPISASAERQTLPG